MSESGFYVQREKPERRRHESSTVSRILVPAVLALASSALAVSKQESQETNTIAISNIDVVVDHTDSQPTVKRVLPATFDASELFHTHPSYLESAETAAALEVDGVPFSVTLGPITERGETKVRTGLVEGAMFPSTFTSYHGAVSARIQGPGWHLTLLRIGREQVLIEWDDHQVSKGLANDQIEGFVLSGLSTESRVERAIRQPRTPILVSPRGCGPGQVLIQQKNLLYVYDQTALDRWFKGDVDGLTSFAYMAADFNNQVKENSQVTSQRVKLVGVKPFSYTSNGVMQEDLTAVVNSSEVAAMKADTGAIEVGLLVGRGGDNNIIGLATGGIGYSGASPYHVAFVGNEYTLAHEDGHNDGETHQKESIVNLLFPFAQGWYLNGFGYDVMSIWLPDLCPTNCEELPVLSNPNVQFVPSKDGHPAHVVSSGGTPVGIEDQAENWRMPAIAYPRLGAVPVCVEK